MITITSNSMDELNTAFKKLKDRYKAVSPIKLDAEVLQYRLELEKKTLSPMVKNLIDKIIDLCDEIRELNHLDLEVFSEFIEEYKGQYVFLNQLDQMYKNLDATVKTQILEYISDELSLEHSENDREEVVA